MITPSNIYFRSTQELGLKKEFKRSSDFSSRNSRPDTFSDVSRGREVIVRRESLSTTSSTLDPRQVKERFVLYLSRKIITIVFLLNLIKLFVWIYTDTIVQIPHLILVNAKYDVPSPRRIEALEILIRDTVIVSNLRHLARHVSMTNRTFTRGGFSTQHTEFLLLFPFL